MIRRRLTPNSLRWNLGVHVTRSGGKLLVLAFTLAALYTVVGCGRDTSSTPGSGSLLPGPSVEFTLTEDLRLGVDDPLFGSVGRVVVLNDGRILVADTSDPPALHSFSEAGEYLGVFGSSGEGPGEYTRLSAVLAAGDSLVIHDSRRDLINVYDLDGAWRRSIPRTGEAPITSANLLAIRENGYLAVQSPGQQTGMNEDPRGYAYRLVGADGVLRDTIWTSPRNDYLVYSDENVIAAMDRPFGRTTHCAVATGILTCAWSADLRFDRLTIDGDTLATIRVAFDPIPVTAAERAEAHQNVHEWFADKLEVPDTRPALADLSAADDGSIWAKVVVSKDEESSTYWVIDPNTGLVSTSTITGNVELKVIRDEHAYGVLTDPTGEEYVVRYLIGPRSPSA